MDTNTLRSAPKIDIVRSEHSSSVFNAWQIDKRLPKTAQVYELLRSAIILMKLPPGASIVERDICEALGISRTPLREAVIQLSSESLVIVKPGEGTFVNLIVLKEVLDGQITRDTLEKRLVQLAARNFDPAFTNRFEISLFQQRKAADAKDMDEFFVLDNNFHKLICECSGFFNSWRTIHSVTGQLDRVRRYALPKADHFVESLQEHSAIYDRIRSRDEEGAADAFQSHIDRLFNEVELIRELDPELISYDSDVSTSSIR